jgi:hypothetical protein
VSIVNTETGKQATQRLPEGVDEVIPVYSGGVLALILKGPALRLIAAFNFHDGKWYSQDLKEPTTQASPIVGPQEATYQLGRYIYIFSTLAQKWSVLELKRAPANNGGGFPGMGGMQNGKMIVPEGDILHVYNGKTGEWTHVDTNAPDVEKVPDLTRVGSGAGSVARPRKGNPPVADTPAPQPTVRTLSGNPMLFAVISAERDRVTMINATTQQRETLRLPQAMTEIIPIDSGRLIGLLMKGPQVTRVGFYDRQAAKWFEHDLKEAATEVQPLINNGPSVGKSQTLIGLQLKGPEFTRLDVFDGRQNLWTTQDLREPAKGEVAPIVSMNTISYRLGRFLYSYSGIAKKWAVLELKREDAVLQGLDVGGGGLLSLDPTGKLIVPEGDMIHIYDPSTGDWTHIDTKDEK